MIRKSNISRGVFVLIGFGLVCACGIADWFITPEIALSILYLVPISLVAWKTGRGLGVATAILCGVIWLIIERLTDTRSYSHLFIPYWNGFVRLSIFCLVAILVSEIVERKRIEAELQNQRGILQSVLDSMGEGLVVANAEGKLLLLNPVAERMLDMRGARPATLLELQDVYLPDLLRTHAAGQHPLTRALRGESVDAAELCLSRAGKGEDLWLLINGRPLLNAAGARTGAVIILSDITARRNLERQLAETSDREQRRLGQDLHDGLCQHLVSIGFATQILADKLQQQSLPEADESAKIVRLLNEAISQARNVARGLYLVQLDIGGLASALEELAAQVQSLHHLSCTFEDKTAVPITETFAANDLFRIAQEAVNNAVKHANAKHINIRLTADDECVEVAVEDDGVGFAFAYNKTRGMGVHIMNYRARMIGATCTIETPRGGGTIVKCSTPRSTAKTGNGNVPA